MKLNCSIVEDLLPLYLEELCSEESKSALEEHLRECHSCSEKFARMKNGQIIPHTETSETKPLIQDYAKKVRHHRICAGISIAFICLLAICALTILGLTLLDMRRAANPPIYELEDGVYNLTSAALESTAEELEQYVFYTNTAKISVKVDGNRHFQGTFMLWDKENSGSFIQICEVDEKTSTCTFTGLSASRRYMITCDGLAGANIAVSDGQDNSFLNSLSNVLNELGLYILLPKTSEYLALNASNVPLSRLSRILAASSL